MTALVAIEEAEVERGRIMRLIPGLYWEDKINW